MSHLRWASAFEEALRQDGSLTIIVGAPEVCAAWAKEMLTKNAPSITFPIDSFDLLRDHDFVYRNYLIAQYSTPSTSHSLFEQLKSIRARIMPDMVFHSSQQSTVREVFAGIPVIGMEQGVLVRKGHHFRVCLDPSGHQVNSILDLYQERIKTFPLDESEILAMMTLLDDLKLGMIRNAQNLAAIEELRHIRAGQKIALFALQTPGGVPCCEGYDAFDLVSLVLAFEQNLPDGWIGVPTFHYGFQLTAEVKLSLARGGRRIRFLSSSHDTDVTEALMIEADALITVNSTSAMTALLLGKRAISVGLAALRGWGAARIQDLDQSPTLSPAEAASVMAFLTNRHAWLLHELIANPAKFIAILQGLEQGGVEWCFNRSDWTPAAARSLFVGI